MNTNTSSYKCQQALDGLKEWMSVPSPLVGHLDTGLKALPTQTDNASQRGCKSQSYTSWAWLPHSFVVGGGAYVPRTDIAPKIDTGPCSKEEEIIAYAMTPEIWKTRTRSEYKKNLTQRVMLVKETSELMTVENLSTQFEIPITIVNSVFDSKANLCRKKRMSDKDMVELQREANLIMNQEKDKNKGKASTSTSSTASDATLDIRQSSAREDLTIDRSGTVPTSAQTGPKLTAEVQTIIQSIKSLIKNLNYQRLVPTIQYHNSTIRNSDDFISYSRQDIRLARSVEDQVSILIARLALHEDILTWISAKMIKVGDQRIVDRISDQTIFYLATLANDLNIDDEQITQITRRKRNTSNKRRVNNVADTIDDWNTKNIPVRILHPGSSNVGSLDSDSIGSDTTYTSALYDSLKSKLLDPISQNPLGSVVKGPNILDFNALLVLMKQMTVRTSSIHDTAPLVRALCIAMSVHTEVCAIDPTAISMIQRTKPNLEGSKSIKISPYNLEQLDVSKMIVMDWVTYTRFISRQIEPFAGIFEVGNIDTTWTTIPIRGHQIKSSGLLTYLFSHLTSEYWNGTVNYQQDLTHDIIDNSPDKNGELHARVCTMPSVNSVHIPGVRNAIIVVTDWNTPKNAPNICLRGGTRIPVYDPQSAQPILPVDVTPAWVSYWQTQNINTIRSDITLTVNELSQYSCTKFAVERARTIVSDLHATLRQGLGIPAKRWDPAFDTENADVTGYSTYWPMHGAHVFSNLSDEHSEIDVPFLKDSPWLANRIKKDNINELARFSQGYNFSALSASHGGIANKATAAENDSEGVIRWNNPKPDSNTPDYECETVASATRIAIRVGLYNIDANNKIFTNFAALGQWIQMNSTAIAASTSIALALNSIPTSEWSGWQVSSQFTDRSREMQQLICIYTSAIRRWKDLSREDIYQDQTIIDDVCSYYSLTVRPFESKDWFNFSPVPIHMWTQWLNKRLPQYSPNESSTYVTTNISGHSKRAIKIDENNPFRSVLSMSSIDTARYLPCALSREPEHLNEPVMVYWVEPTAWITATVTQHVTKPNYEFLESKVPNYRTINLFEGYQETTPVYICNSNQALSEAKTFVIRTSPLMYPDPPGLSENDKAPLQKVEEISATPSTAVMDAVQNQSSVTGPAE